MVGRCYVTERSRELIHQASTCPIGKETRSYELHLENNAYNSSMPVYWHASHVGGA